MRCANSEEATCDAHRTTEAKRATSLCTRSESTKVLYQTVPTGAGGK